MDDIITTISYRMLRIWLQVFTIWIRGTQLIRFAVVSIHWRTYVMTSMKQSTQIYHKWQTPLRKRAWRCVIFHRKLNGHCCVCRTQPVRRHSILVRPTPTSGNTTFMGITHCWPYAQHYCWYSCAPYAVYYAAFVANGPTAMAMIAATKELVHDFWFCKFFVVCLFFQAKWWSNVKLQFISLQSCYHNLPNDIHPVGSWFGDFLKRLSVTSRCLCAIEVSKNDDNRKWF